jgi:hypothetical protein
VNLSHTLARRSPPLDRRGGLIGEFHRFGHFLARAVNSRHLSFLNRNNNMRLRDERAQQVLTFWTFMSDRVD